MNPILTIFANDTAFQTLGWTGVSGAISLNILAWAGIASISAWLTLLTAIFSLIFVMMRVVVEFTKIRKQWKVNKLKKEAKKALGSTYEAMKLKDDDE